jgi:hypothetical protein
LSTASPSTAPASLLQILHPCSTTRAAANAGNRRHHLVVALLEKEIGREAHQEVSPGGEGRTTRTVAAA